MQAASRQESAITAEVFFMLVCWREVASACNKWERGPQAGATLVSESRRPVWKAEPGS
jgi:hypothetical protein